MAATYRDLKTSVKEGRFREDLYYRLAVITIHIPALRERPEDIPLLARHFASELAHGDADLADNVIELLQRYEWPGNVRELRNTVWRALSLGTLGEDFGTVDPVSPEDDRSHAGRPYKVAREHLLNEFEARYIKDILERNASNISQAARAAGIGRAHLRDLMRKHGLYQGDE